MSVRENHPINYKLILHWKLFGSFVNGFVNGDKIWENFSISIILVYTHHMAGN